MRGQPLDLVIVVGRKGKAPQGKLNQQRRYHRGCHTTGGVIQQGVSYDRGCHTTGGVMRTWYAARDVVAL